MKASSLNSGLTRRRFLAVAGAAMTAPMIVPASALGQGRPAPSERITMGVVGWGMQGPGNTRAFLNQKDCQVVAACDVDKRHLQQALNTINGKYENKDCKAYADYRALMARDDIDAVMLAVPDHWHALIAVEAAKQKKDIYGEKPLARTVAEQQAIVKAVADHGRIWQTGSWQRSVRSFHKACEIVRNGMIGKVTHVEVGLPAGHTDFARTSKALLDKLAALPVESRPARLAQVVPATPAWELAVTKPPVDLDYETWIGPAQMQPYIESRVHMNWRWDYNIGGGQLLDWIGHHCDIAHWGLDFDQTGPDEVEGEGEFPAKDALWNTSTRYRITAKYANDVTMTIAGGHRDIRGGTKWIGTDGWVWVDRGAFNGSNEEWREVLELPEDQRKVKLYKSNDHQRNFLDCVKSRQPAIAPAEVAHHSAIPGHLGLISMLVHRKIKWDPEKEVIIGDAEAGKFLGRAYRSPWKLA